MDQRMKPFVFKVLPDEMLRDTLEAYWGLPYQDILERTPSGEWFALGEVIGHIPRLFGDSPVDLRLLSNPDCIYRGEHLHIIWKSPDSIAYRCCLEIPGYNEDVNIEDIDVAEHNAIYDILIDAPIIVSFHPIKDNNEFPNRWNPKHLKAIESALNDFGGNKIDFRKKKEYIYLFKESKSMAIKIGRTWNVKKRLKGIQTSNPNKIQVIYYALVENPHDVERRLHEKYAANRKMGEWFSLSEIEIKGIIDSLSKISLDSPV